MTDIFDNIPANILDQFNKNTFLDGDPSGVYPTREYTDHPSTNKRAIGAKTDELKVKGSFKDIDLDLLQVGASQAGFSQVKETKSGHVIQYDDTKGNERIMIKHRLGSGVEIRADGTMILNSVKNSVRVTANDDKVLIDGDGEIQYNGNLKLKVAGDFDLEVGGDYNVSVAGDVEEKIKRGYQRDVTGNVENTITGDRTETIVGSNTRMILGQNNDLIKGNNFLNVGGQMQHFVGDTLTMTAEHEVVLTTLSANISASSLAVQGDSGTIGGANMVYYGHTAHIPRVNATSVHATQGVIATVGMTAPTFNGNLSGNANTSGTAGAIGAGSGQSPVTITPAPDSDTSQPTTEILNDTLNASPIGIRRVTIDEQDFIKDAIDRSKNYGGVSKTDLDTKEARSKLRDPNNLNNEEFIGAIISEGIISSDFASVAPRKINRMVGSEKTLQRGDKNIGPASGAEDIFE